MNFEPMSLREFVFAMALTAGVLAGIVICIASKLIEWSLRIGTGLLIATLFVCFTSFFARGTWEETQEVPRYVH